MQKIMFLAIAIFLAGFAYSNACIVVAGGYDGNVAINKENYFTLTVMNKSADGNVSCEEADYSVKLEIKDKNVSDYFDYKISENNFHLVDGSFKKVMLILIPKVSGNYEILATAIRKPNTSTSTQTIAYTASIKYKLAVEGDTFKQPEIWYTHDYCEEAKVWVEKGKECPVVEKQVVAVQDELPAEEKKTPVALATAIDDKYLVGGGIIILIAVSAYVLMSNAKKTQRKDGSYDI